MARRPPPGAPALSRTTATHDPAKPVAIFCEGATEESCLKGLRGRWRVPAVTVQVVGQVGAPKTVVESAKAYVAGLGRRAARPTVVVVFDRDEHPSWAAAMEMARVLEYVRAVSNPCIELWGLLLHRDQSANIHRHDAQRELSELHRGYHHDRSPYFDIDLVLEGMSAAETRALALDARAAAAGAQFTNPTTSVPSHQNQPPARLLIPRSPRASQTRLPVAAIGTWFLARARRGGPTCRVDAVFGSSPPVSPPDAGARRWADRHVRPRCGRFAPI